MKCAFGENPKRCYQNQGISSRMTTASKIREALNTAKLYKAKKEAAGDDISKLPSSLSAAAFILKSNDPTGYILLENTYLPSLINTSIVL